ncbi:uncharacterized protein [Panulirus ornatus]|uniref:uncharacterized protein isoform X2 n=1 Tax=Panulirus ornatus TaxID=150431 RepID=UPI003A89F425
MVGVYTGLPAEVAATVPRRPTLRHSWVRHSPETPLASDTSSATDNLTPTDVSSAPDIPSPALDTPSPAPDTPSPAPDTPSPAPDTPSAAASLSNLDTPPPADTSSASDTENTPSPVDIPSVADPQYSPAPSVLPSRPLACRSEREQQPRPTSVVLTTYCPPGGAAQEFRGLPGQVSRVKAFFESHPLESEESELSPRLLKEDQSATAVTYRVKNPYRSSPRPRLRRYRNTISAYPLWPPGGAHNADQNPRFSAQLDQQGNIVKPSQLIYRTQDDTDLVEIKHIKPVLLRKRYGTITGIVRNPHEKQEVLDSFKTGNALNCDSSRAIDGVGVIVSGNTSSGSVEGDVIISGSTGTGAEITNVVNGTVGSGAEGGSGSVADEEGVMVSEASVVVSGSTGSGEEGGLLVSGSTGSGGEGAGVAVEPSARLSKGWDAERPGPPDSPLLSCPCDHASVVFTDATDSECQASVAGGHEPRPQTMVVPEDGQVQATPRVVAACIKSYRDIPEELFNSLQESSVDPVAPGPESTSPPPSPSIISPPPPTVTTPLPPTPAPRSDWRTMREGRRALLTGEVSDADTEEGSEGDLGGVASTSDYHTSDGRGSSLSGASDDHHRNNDHRHDDHIYGSQKGGYHNHDVEEAGYECYNHHVSAPTALIRNNFRGFCSTMLGPTAAPTRPDLPPARPPPPQEFRSRSPSPDDLRRPTQLEEELRAAGVYFRRPGSPLRVPVRNHTPIRTNTPSRTYTPTRNHTPSRSHTPPRSEVEAVTAALDELDASLAGLSGSSGESSPARSHASSVVERSQSGADPAPVHTPASRCPGVARSLHADAGEDVCADTTSQYNHERGSEDTADDSRTPVEAGRVLGARYGAGTGGGRPVGRVGGAVQDGVPRHAHQQPTNDAVMENLNLIEEVYVDTRAVPHSSVSMHAYYPGIQYTPVSHASTKPVAAVRNSSMGLGLRGSALLADSDSGHESGATSPCGTLTRQDTHSPPPSPHHAHSSSSVIHSRTSSLQSCRGAGVLEGEVGVAVVGDSGNSVGASVGGVLLEPRPPTHFVVVAIDFGTTYSGYAFSFTRDPDSVHMMKKWEGGDPGVQNQKTPTIVLLTPEGRFHSLGFTARDTYHDLDPKEAKRWLYFDKFKMALHADQTLSRETLLEAANGRKVPALEIFTYALRYFRDHALRELSDQAGVAVLEEDVRWVITVPAIWSHPAKQFMRTAAYQAGMGSSSRPEQLLIALEPEAAAIYCRRLRRHQLLPERPPELRPPRHCAPRDSLCPSEPSSVPALPELDRDTVYAVVDCGGGTVDITVHQMTDRLTGHLKELHKATGGPYGSTGVDAEFERFLETIFSPDFLATFRQQRPAAYVDLMIAFESRKRNASPYRSNPLNIALPFSFIDLYRKFKGKDVEWAIKKHQQLGVRWSAQGMLRVEQETMRQLFLPTLSNITQAIEAVLSAPEVGPLQYMFLVGGFAESELLQKHIRDTFGHRVNVIIPQGMGLAILRGAVQFGLDPGVVTVRRSRLTYGVGVLNRYQRGIHPTEKRVVAAGSEWCADVLDRFVVVDESVAVGDVVVRSYTPATPAQTTVILHLYATHCHNAKFVTEDGVQRVGTLHLDLGPTSHHHQDPSKARREITVHMKFGDTEVKASAVDHLTGQCVKANIDFLTL